MRARVGRIGYCIGFGLVLACSSQSEEPKGSAIGKSRHAITSVGARVLGFEAPVTDWLPLWSSPTVAQSDVERTEGSAALALSGGGWMSIASPRLSKQGPTPEAITLDIRLPQEQPDPFWFGTVELLLDAPSVGLNQALAAQVPLTGLPVEEWRTLSFPLPAFIRNALAGDWTDLRLNVIVNTPSGAPGVYYLDHMTFGAMCTPEDDGDACTSDVCDATTGQTTHTILPSCPGSPSGESGPNAGILGFEVSGFTATSGAALNLADDHVEGAHALAVSGFQNTLIESPSLSTLSTVTDTVGFDLLLPFEPFGPPISGSVQLYLHAPSRNVHNAWVGQKNLDGAILGAFRRVEFKLPSSVHDALSTGSYNDLRFRIQIDLPQPASKPILLDRFTFNQHPVQPPAPVPSLDTERTLGFETAANWQITSGTLALSDDAVQGNYAIAVSGFTSTRLTSARMASLGPIDGKLRLDLRVPEPADPHWAGWLNVFISIPSQGIYSQYVGGKGLTGLAPGSFHRITFDLPSDLKNILESAAYSDLTIEMTLDVPQGSDEYRFDALNFRTLPFIAPANEVSHVRFDVDLPNGVELDDVTLYRGVQRVLPTNAFLSVFGPSEVRHPTKGWGTIVAAVGAVLLNNPSMPEQPVVTGSAFSGGELQTILGQMVTVHGAVKSSIGGLGINNLGNISAEIDADANLGPWSRLPWELELPPGNDIQDVPSGSNVNLAAGEYDLLEPTDAVHLFPGLYVFNRINLAPTSVVVLHSDPVEPIVVVSRGRIDAYGQVLGAGVEPPNAFWINAPTDTVTSSEFVNIKGEFEGNLFGHLVRVGHQDANQTRLQGSVFAGASLQVINAVVEHKSMGQGHCDGTCGFTFGCPDVDSDSDGLSNCEEQEDEVPWTSPSAFNGLRVRHGPACGDATSCETVDSIAEADACAANMTASVDQFAWLSRQTTRVCANHSFLPGWTTCSGPAWAADLSGFFRWDVAGKHCFTLGEERTIAPACATLFIQEQAYVLHTEPEFRSIS